MIRTRALLFGLALASLLAPTAAPAAAIPLDVPVSAGCSSAGDNDFAMGLGRVVERAIVASGRGHDDTVSLALYDRVRETLCTARARAEYYQASTVKVAILAALLRERSTHPSPRCLAGELCGEERADAERMIRISDNAAAIRLYGRAGGPVGLRRFLALLGMDETRPAAAFGATVTTAADQLRLLRALTSHGDVLSDAQRAYVLGLMRTVRRTELLWFGVPADAPAGTQVADKIGLNTWPDHGRARAHSIGAVRGPDTRACRGHDYMMALFSDDNADFVAGAKRVNLVASAINRYMAAHPPRCDAPASARRR